MSWPVPVLTPCQTVARNVSAGDGLRACAMPLCETEMTVVSLLDHLAESGITTVPAKSLTVGVSGTESHISIPPGPGPITTESA
jgi:hypothetical protein